MEQRTKVVIAGSAIYFTFGIYMSWSVIAGGLIEELGWSIAETSFPVAVDSVVFGIAMIIGGRINDKYGPGKGSVIGAVIASLSFILLAYMTAPGLDHLRYLTGTLFGFLSGFGSAMTFAVIQPSVLRWYPPDKRGKVIGFLYMALQGAPLFWAFAVGLALYYTGIRQIIFGIGIFFFAVLIVSAQMIKVPESERLTKQSAASSEVPLKDTLREIFKNSLLIPACLISFVRKFAISSINMHLNQIVFMEYGLQHGYVYVSMLAVFTIAGCLLGGLLIDKKGEIDMLKASFLLVSLAMVLFYLAKSFSTFGSIALVTAATLLLGLTQGAMNTSISILTVNIFGVEKFGIAFGIIFALGSVFGPFGGMFFGWIADLTGSFASFFISAFFLSLIGYYLSAYVGNKRRSRETETLDGAS